MGNYCGPKVRLSRSVGAPIAETPKHTNMKRTTRPGMHGYRPARRTLYGRQLAEKQKLAMYYNIRNTQLRLYMTKAVQSKVNTPEALQEMLEARLDNVVRRLGWARTIWQARQLVSHGHLKVNGRRVDRPGYSVTAGDQITVKDSSKPYIKQCIASCTEALVPAWLQPDNERCEAQALRMPTPEDVRLPFEIDYTQVVEFYTR
ncbi:MAG TPA: 30S ribosomal protein S4 [Phycisphaerae bacterium]|nr:30S ribosomal protein S4 [Phycisphaerae bacterium]